LVNNMLLLYLLTM